MTIGGAMTVLQNTPDLRVTLWLCQNGYWLKNESVAKSLLRVQRLGPLPSGKLAQLWKITIFNGKINYKWPFSIANCFFRKDRLLGPDVTICLSHLWAHYCQHSALSASCALSARRPIPRCPSFLKILLSRFNGLVGNLQESPMIKNGKSYGFRLSFSLKPIHWEIRKLVYNWSRTYGGRIYS